jgi:hypothetical protein
MVTLKRTINNSHLRCALTLILSLFVTKLIAKPFSLGDW